MLYQYKIVGEILIAERNGEKIMLLTLCILYYTECIEYSIAKRKEPQNFTNKSGKFLNSLNATIDGS